MTEIQKDIDFPEIPASITSELTFIRKGLLSYYIDDDLYFFYISDQEDIELLYQTNEITIELDAILRDEFPSIRDIFTFYLDKLKIKTLDHYFSLESDQELQHLQQLYEDNCINFILYQDSTKYIKKFYIKNDDLTFIRRTLDEIESQFDKS